MAYIPPNPNGQATKTNSSPVVLASNQDALPITDNSGSLTVDQSTATNLNTTAQVTDGTNTANVVAGDTGYNALAIASSTKTYTFTTSSSGAQTLLANTDCRGYAWVTVVTTSVGSGLGWNGQFSPNSGGTYITSQTWQDKTATGSVPGAIGTSVNKFYGSPTVSNFFELSVSALTSGTLSGYVILSTTPDPYTTINVAGAGTLTTQGTKTNNNAAPGAINIGVLPAIANAAQPAWTEGDQVLESADLRGNQRVRISDAAGNDRGVNVTAGNAGQADLTSIAGTAVVTGGVAGSQSVGGTVATNVAITANPINLGAQAVSSENSAATTARQVQLVADLVGKLIVMPYANPENFVSGTATATDTTSTSLVASPGGSLRNYITQFTVWNSSAVNTYIKIQDGSGGTTLYVLPCPTVGGSVINLPTPLRQPTTATGIFFAANASANAVFVSASGYKGL